MSAFYVWNPSIPKNSNIVECVVTTCDTPGIARDYDSIAALLHELQVDETPEHWTITCCRSKYYTDYPDSTDWPDIWQIVWNVRITTARPIRRKRQPRQVIPWREADIWGEDWIKEPAGKVMCLAVSDFPNQTSMQNAQQAILNDSAIQAMQRASSLSAPVFQYTKVLNKYPQLHILLGEFDADFYAHGAPYAERVLQVCQQHGGTLNFSERRK